MGKSDTSKPARHQQAGLPDFAASIISAAAEVAKSVNAAVLFAYTNAVTDLDALVAAVQKPTKLILVCRDAHDEQRAKTTGKPALPSGKPAMPVHQADLVRSMTVPAFDLTRMGQIKMATLIAFSQGLLRPQDVFVFISGVSGRDVDTVVTMRVGEEYELFQSVGQPRLTEHIRRAVFEKVLRIALELAHEGREGKPIGAVFVIGNHQDVQKHCQDGRINPFKGYTEKERNILDDSIDDTVKEIAKLDGAFVLKGNGVILSACVILRGAIAGEALPQGLGARHAAAAAITASTKSIAISLSESTGDVRIWRRGTLITEIEKAPHSLIDRTSPPSVG